MISKWKYNYIDEEKGMALTIQSLKQEIEKLVDELEEQEQHIKEANFEIKRLNNIINELKEWFKGYHKSYASCKWYEEDYIEFIEHLENELKGEDKE